MLGANMENVDAPSVSEANELRQDVLDPSGLQYYVPSVSSHAYSNTNASQPSTMGDPQGNNQAHTRSHLSNLMIEEVPETRYRLANSSTSRGFRSGADRGGQSNSVHSSSTGNMTSRPPVSGSGTASVNSSQRQTIASSSANKHMVTDGPVSLQSSSGFEHGVPGQLSMSDIVKMGRPQGKASSKPVVTADRGYAGQYPSLPNTNQNLKQSVSMVPPTELDKGLQPAQDSVQVKNHGHSAADSKLPYGTDWSPQDDPTSLPETSGDPSLYEASFQSSTLVTDVVNSHENSHLDENSTFAMRPAPASERHLEPSDGISEYNDGMLNNSSSYQRHNYSYTEQEAAANFQSLSLHNDELAAKKTAEDNPAVIIPDHLQVTETERASLSFGSFGSGAFSGLLPRKATDRNVEFPAREESAPVDQLDARNQDYYESGAVTSQADENLEAMLGANMENVDAPSVSEANELRQDVLDPSGLQYYVPSVSSHAYSNTNASQPSTMGDPQGNNQAHTRSHLSNLMIEEVPETRYRLANSSTSRGFRSGADRGGQSNSVHSSSTGNMTSRPPVSGSGTASVNSSQRQTIASSSANKHMVTDGPVSLQSSSGFEHGVPGQLSMSDIVKMGRPQGKASSKPVVTADRGYAGQYPSLPNTNQHLKQSVSMVPPTELDKGLQPAQDSVQVKNHGHSAADSKLPYGTDWSPQDDPTSLPETSGDPSLYEASFQSSTLVTDVVNSHENSHLDENSTFAMRPAPASERHLEPSDGISEYNDGMLNNSSSYQRHNYSYTEQEAAAANFQSLSLHNDELAAKKTAEDNPAVIIPDHLQVTETERVSLSFGSFGSGAFSGLLPRKATDRNVEFPAREESAPVDQLDARNQDYYESGAVTSQADENLEAMLGANMENVDAPSVSEANELRQDVLDPSGLQYYVPSVSSHAYSNTNASQPSTMGDPQGNNQAHTRSHLSNLMIEEVPEKNNMGSE
ncbi:uncharacterized protein [Miscanthus floridulus]|uniref:uncharacterized protein isoform X3 n=1 Tax=Miscanthus floridulus TaxID=154761 RepID=UPI0034599CD3